MGRLQLSAEIPGFCVGALFPRPDVIPWEAYCFAVVLSGEIFPGDAHYLLLSPLASGHGKAPYLSPSAESSGLYLEGWRLPADVHCQAYLQTFHRSDFSAHVFSQKTPGSKLPSSPSLSSSNVFYNHTFPEYLISTILQPRRIYRHTHRPRKRKIAPKQPLLLSPVVRLINPPCYPLRIHGSTTTKPLNSNFGELDVRRLARCCCFILNFMF